MSATVDWVTDLYRAVEELGYFVESLDMHGSLVISDRQSQYITIEFRGILLSGPYLRSVLKPTPGALAKAQP